MYLSRFNNGVYGLDKNVTGFHLDAVSGGGRINNVSDGIAGFYRKLFAVSSGKGFL